MRNRSVLAVFMVLFLFALSSLTADSTIQRGIDVFFTPGDGRTYYDFAHSPIPAGFFCKGSKPFTGKVAFKGLPLTTETPGQLWNADTVVERLDDAVFDVNGVATTRIQFRALSLVSIAPVKTSCGAFHVYISLGGKQRVTAMNIYRTHEGGGNFVAPLAVDVRMTFIPVKPVRNRGARKLEIEGDFTFPSKPIPWSFREGAAEKRIGPVIVDTNGDLTPDTLLPGTTNFTPGRSDRSPTKSEVCFCEWVCHDQGTEKAHCAGVPPPPPCRQDFCWA